MFLRIYRGTCSSEYSEERCPSVYFERIFINGSIDGYMSKNASIDVYPYEVLLRYIPRRFLTNWCSSEFPRKCVSSEFRRKIPRKEEIPRNYFRGLVSSCMSDIMILLHTNQWSLVTKGTTPSMAKDAGVGVGKGNF
ncbi:hypothetical protein DY000_02032794 [Brassica cretica]|uniref:Uncharacterized protein n=1 Tax=Brassica cretica TaxID=69181 RepID=A0ABQ7DX31_BRACR|nr:hypothetical protein DY000_02032794 [Brassica cretica]